MNAQTPHTDIHTSPVLILRFASLSSRHARVLLSPRLYYQAGLACALECPGNYV